MYRIFLSRYDSLTNRNHTYIFGIILLEVGLQMNTMEFIVPMMSVHGSLGVGSGPRPTEAIVAIYPLSSWCWSCEAIGNNLARVANAENTTSMLTHECKYGCKRLTGGDQECNVKGGMLTVTSELASVQHTASDMTEGSPESLADTSWYSDCLFDKSGETTVDDNAPAWFIKQSCEGGTRIDAWNPYLIWTSQRAILHNRLCKLINLLDLLSLQISTSNYLPTSYTTCFASKAECRILFASVRVTGIPQQPTAVVTTIPGSLLIADPTIVSGTSMSTSADHDSDMDVVLRNLITGTIRASLVSYQTQTTIFNMLLLGGAPSNISIDSSGNELH
ncbi:hypothetical protein BKA83DRAFT_4132880 [Pisolithus microcarpus]|nr:hypothetical protein BKA83DRAFT_4132880 [Pisolithus microcarpus]